MVIRVKGGVIVQAGETRWGPFGVEEEGGGGDLDYLLITGGVTESEDWDLITNAVSENRDYETIV